MSLLLVFIPCVMSIKCILVADIDCYKTHLSCFPLLAHYPI